MKKIFLYGHGGSGNHGCEAIVRSTISIISQNTETPIYLITSNPEEDKYYGIDELCSLIREKNTYSKWSLEFLIAYLKLKLDKNYIPMDKLEYKKAFDYVEKGDLAFAIGGDNYCYADVERHIMMHEIMLERGAKTVLWGCSVEPDILTNEKIVEDLRKYNLITARETITYSALKKINQNTVLSADSAFRLRTMKTELPDGFLKENMIGINISPMVKDNEKIQGIVLQNYNVLIQKILQTTNMGIVLIPHVVWKDSNDKKILQQIFDAYKSSGRVWLVTDQNCEKIKYIISKCRFFIAARTHASIAAYSSCIPSLVVGYSVKARGIARDLFGDENNYVISVQDLTNSNELYDKFRWVMENEMKIKKRLERVIPEISEGALNSWENLKEVFWVK